MGATPVLESCARVSSVRGSSGGGGSFRREVFVLRVGVGGLPCQKPFCVGVSFDTIFEKNVLYAAMRAVAACFACNGSNRPQVVCFESLPVIGGVYAKSYDHTTLTTSRYGIGH